MDTWRNVSHVSKLKEKKRNGLNKEKRQRGPQKTGSVREGDGEKNFRERSSTFSIRSMEIGSWVFVRARGKVGPRIESYAWVPKSWSFVKLHGVGNFLL